MYLVGTCMYSVLLALSVVLADEMIETKDEMRGDTRGDTRDEMRGEMRGNTRDEMRG
ncbi:hypothetical protein BDV95DRAFT_140810 [Massariosphaeria phaeospora]|uniref:Uncharacterized protein n=1 Tax=Massariosphaeria phaeospora TaxID=100035 RepID=A0A7C8ILD9_9PLEO|nr:hypothetical protein BDV95DRAFT_140810 [Massariosphaeria phaeospora]